jgi:hypothetical protein
MTHVCFSRLLHLFRSSPIALKFTLFFSTRPRQIDMLIPLSLTDVPHSTCQLCRTRSTDA